MFFCFFICVPSSFWWVHAPCSLPLVPSHQQSFIHAFNHAFMYFYTQTHAYMHSHTIILAQCCTDMDVLHDSFPLNICSFLSISSENDSSEEDNSDGAEEGAVPPRPDSGIGMWCPQDMLCNDHAGWIERRKKNIFVTRHLWESHLTATEKCSLDWIQLSLIHWFADQLTMTVFLPPLNVM